MEVKTRNDARIATVIYAAHHTETANNKFKKPECPINSADRKRENTTLQYIIT